MVKPQKHAAEGYPLGTDQKAETAEREPNGGLPLVTDCCQPVYVS